MLEVADEHGLDFAGSLEENIPQKQKKKELDSEAKLEEQRLEERLRKLQEM